jgi:hypothetical protein
MGKVQNALSSGVEKTRNALAEVRRRPKNALMDYTRGALMGVTTDVLGYPVDTLSMAMRPFGYNVDQPIGGSDWLANKLTSPTGSPSEMAGRITTGMLTPGPDEMLRLAGMLPKRGPVNELITYHGSPHRINNVDEANPMGKFDLSKVGTGEGAQAYGHGIYLAETPGVASTYRPKGWKPSEKYRYKGRDGMEIYQEFVDRQEYDKAAVWEKILLHMDKPKILAQLDEGETAARAYVSSLPDKLFAKPGGHLYTVDLPDEHIAKMLDWDKPLSEQPEAVRKALEQIGEEKLGMLVNYGVPLKDNSIIWRKSGAELYSGIANKAGKFDPNNAVATFGEEKKFASEYLRSLGIPGIKYLDGGSRAAGNGTRNFVIFDGDTAKILKRE